MARLAGRLLLPSLLLLLAAAAASVLPAARATSGAAAGSWVWGISIFPAAGGAQVYAMRPYERYELRIRVSSAETGEPSDDASRRMALVGAMPSVLQTVASVRVISQLELADGGDAAGVYWSALFEAADPTVACVRITTELTGEADNAARGDAAVGVGSAVAVADTVTCAATSSLPAPSTGGTLAGLGTPLDDSRPSAEALEAALFSGSADPSGALFAVYDRARADVLYTAASMVEQAAVRLAPAALWGGDGSGAGAAPQCADWAASNATLQQVLGARTRAVVVSAAGLVEGVRFREPEWPEGVNEYSRWTPTPEELREAWAGDLEWEVRAARCVRLAAVPSQLRDEAPETADMVLAAADGPAVLLSLARGGAYAELPSEGGPPAGSSVLALEVGVLRPSDVLALVRDDGGRYAFWRYRAAFGSLVQAARQDPGGLATLLEVHGGGWAALAALPARVPALEEPSGDGALRPALCEAGGGADASCGDVVLALDAAAMSRGPGHDLFAWGNAVLYSPDAGESFFVLLTLRDPDGDRVTALDTSPDDGWFALATASGQAWFGQVGRPALVELVPLEPRGDAAGAAAALGRPLPFVPARGVADMRLATLSAEGAAGTVPAALVSGDQRQAVDAQAERATVAASLRCPYTLVEFDAEVASVAGDAVGLAGRSGLPERVYLDRNASYSFGVRVHAAAWVPPAEQLLSLQLAAPAAYLGAELERLPPPGAGGGASVGATLAVSPVQHYRVTVRDRGAAQPQRAPGADPVPGLARLTVRGATAACAPFQSPTPRAELSERRLELDEPYGAPDGEPAPPPARPAPAGSRAWVPAPGGPASWDLPVLSGCPPGRRLNMNRAGSRGRFEQCSEGTDPVSGDAVACASFVYDYEPRLVLEGPGDGDAEPYAGLFTMRIVGGGPTLDSMRPYSESEQADFNQGSRAVWTVLETLSTTEAGSSGGPGAAGAGDAGPDGYTFFQTSEEQVFPSLGILDGATPVSWVCGIGSPCSGVVPEWPSSPDYFFRVRFSTRAANGTTHCDQSVEVTLRLHGLTMDYIAVITATGACIGVLLACILAGYLVTRDRYVEYKALIIEKAEMLDEEREVERRASDERRKSRARMTLMSLNTVNQK